MPRGGKRISGADKTIGAPKKTQRQTRISIEPAVWQKLEDYAKARDKSVAVTISSIIKDHLLPLDLETLNDAKAKFGVKYARVMYNVIQNGYSAADINSISEILEKFSFWDFDPYTEPGSIDDFFFRFYEALPEHILNSKLDPDTSKKRGGRPTLGYKTIKCPLTNENYAKVEKHANRAGIPIAEVLNELIASTVFLK